MHAHNISMENEETYSGHGIVKQHHAAGTAAVLCQRSAPVLQRGAAQLPHHMAIALYVFDKLSCTCSSRLYQIHCKGHAWMGRATSRHSAAQVARMASARSMSTRRCSTSPDSAYVSTDLGTGGTKRGGSTCNRCS